MLGEGEFSLQFLVPPLQEVDVVVEGVQLLLLLAVVLREVSIFVLDLGEELLALACLELCYFTRAVYFYDLLLCLVKLSLQSNCPLPFRLKLGLGAPVGVH